MNAQIKELEKLKSRVEAAKSKKERVKGRYDAAMERLNALGYDTLDDARAALDGMEENIKDMTAKLEGMIDDFKDKYDSVL